MSIVRIKPAQLGRALRGEASRARRALKGAAIAAARRFVAYLANQCDALGITDTGMLKASWKAIRTADGGATVFSDAPHAGVIELGARPHKVSKEEREAIARWAARKLGLSEGDAMRAAWFIAKKIEAHGQKPHYLVRDGLPEARRFFGEEMVRILNREATR